MYGKRRHIIGFLCVICTTYLDIQKGFCFVQQDTHLSLSFVFQANFYPVTGLFPCDFLSYFMFCVRYVHLITEKSMKGNMGLSVYNFVNGCCCYYLSSLFPLFCCSSLLSSTVVGIVLHHVSFPIFYVFFLFILDRHTK